MQPDLPFALNLDVLMKKLGTSKEGLSAQEASRRLELYGPNVLRWEGIRPFAIFARQFKSPLVAILFAAAVLAFAAQETKDSLVILAIVLINAFLGFSQEFRAESAILSLKKLTKGSAKVLRDGVFVSIAADLLVPGDIIDLDEGDIVLADAKLIEGDGLMADESLLTGESLPVVKDPLALLAPDTPVYEQKNMLFSGTHVVKGGAKGVVVATGNQTYFASIAQRAAGESPQSPLTVAIGIFAKKHVLVLLVLLLGIGMVAFWQGRDLFEIAYLIVAELVSSVPEGLPILVTLVLAIGAVMLGRKKVLTRHLPAVEALGSATVIASDKTGTITKGKLAVQRVHAIDEQMLRLVAALANESEGGRGDPIDLALAQWLGEDFQKLRAKHERVGLEPFDAARRYMVSLHKTPWGEKAFVKGAFEALQKLSNYSENYEEMKRWHDEMASNGLRILAFGVGEKNFGGPAEDFQIVGLVGFWDPPKEGVAQAVAQAKKAGVRVLMITGDNPLTAAAIAREIGIYEEGDLVIEGKQIEHLGDGELYELLGRSSVLARFLPEHKYRVVTVLQSRGEIVAVTGDGVNDVPALRAADLGIAMGSGSDAAKAAAKMVLVDNNLCVIVEAIRQGRVIADNIRKGIYFLISTSLDEIFLISGAVLMGLPLPLLPIQILWINLVSDSALDKTFCFIREEGDVMQRGPRKPKEQFFDRAQMLRIFYASLVIGFSTLGLFWLMLVQGFGTSEAQTAAFTALVVLTWLNGIQALKEKEPFFKNIKRSLTINPYIWIGILVGIVLQLSSLTLFSDLFHTAILSQKMLGMIAGLGIFVFGAIEVRKWGELLWSR